MKRSAWAIASLVMGIFSFVNLFGAEKAVVAVIFGVLALKELKKEKLGGKWLAVVGIVLGAISIILIVLALPALLQYISQLSD